MFVTVCLNCCDHFRDAENAKLDITGLDTE